MTQSPRTGPSPWPTLWIRAQTVSTGGGALDSSQVQVRPPHHFSSSPAVAWGAGWPHSHFTEEKTGHTVASLSPTLHPQAAGSVYTVPHPVCVSGLLGDGSYGYRVQQGSPRPCRTSGHGSLDSRPPSDLTAAHPPALSIPGHPGQLGGAGMCVQITPWGLVRGLPRWCQW